MDGNSGPNWDDIYALEEFQATLNADTAALSTAAANGVLPPKSTAETEAGAGLLPTFDNFMAGNQSALSDPLNHIAPIGPIHNVPMMPHIPGIVPPSQRIHNVPIGGSNTNSSGLPITPQVHNAPIGHGHSGLIGHNAPVNQVHNVPMNTPIGHNVPGSQDHNVPINTGSSGAPEELMDFIITRNDIDEPGADVMQSGQTAGLSDGAFFPPFPDAPPLVPASSSPLEPPSAPPPVSTAREGGEGLGSAPVLGEMQCQASVLAKSSASQSTASESSVHTISCSAVSSDAQKMDKPEDRETGKERTREIVKERNGDGNDQNECGNVSNVSKDKIAEGISPISPAKIPLTATEDDVGTCTSTQSLVNTDANTVVHNAEDGIDGQTVSELGTKEKDTVQDSAAMDTVESLIPADTETNGHAVQNTEGEDSDPHNGTECDIKIVGSQSNGKSQAMNVDSPDIKESDEQHNKTSNDTHDADEANPKENTPADSSHHNNSTCNDFTQVIDSRSNSLSEHPNSKSPRQDNQDNANNFDELSTHSDEKSPEQHPGFSCKICGALCTDIPALKSHIQEDHTDEPRLYLCIFCDASYNELQGLQTHMNDDHDATFCHGCGEEILIQDHKEHLMQCKFSMLPDFLHKFKGKILKDLSIERKLQEIQTESNKKTRKRRLYVLTRPKRLVNNKLRARTTPTTPQMHRVYKCSVQTCRKQFDSQEACLDHEKNSHDEDEIELHETGEVMGEEDVMGETGTGQLTCQTCRMVFTTHRNLILHRSVAHRGSIEANQAKKYKCSVCNRKFQKRWKLQDHVKKTHDMDQASVGETLTCEACGESFKSQEHLQRHVATHYTQGLYFCTVCSLQFNNQYQFESHLRTHNNPVRENASSTFVRQTEPTITSLPIAHNQIKSEPLDYGYGDIQPTSLGYPMEENFQPNLNLRIGEAFSLMEPGPATNLTGYRIVKPVGSVQIGYPNPDIPRFSCEECQEEYPSEYDLMIHKTKYHNTEETEKLRCTICDKEFKNKEQLFGHLAKHREPYECEKCGMSYKYYGAHAKICKKMARKRKASSSLSSDATKKARISVSISQESEPDDDDDDEEEEVEDEATRKQIELNLIELSIIDRLYDAAIAWGDNNTHCPSCSTICKTDELKDHLKAHIEEKEMYCPSCAKLYKYSEAFDKHLHLCHKQGKLSCNHCSQMFVSKIMWLVHRLDHYRGKVSYIKLPPLECCKNSYPQIAAYQTHLRQLHGKNLLRIKCQLCQEDQVGLDAYVKHVEQFTSDEQFQCPCCLKRFHDLSAIETHLTISHPNEAEPCGKCSESVLLWELPKHQKTEHGPVYWVDENVSAETRQKTSIATSPTVHSSRSGQTRKGVRYQCGICGKEFSSYYYIKSHGLAEHRNQIEEEILAERGVDEGETKTVSEEDIVKSIMKRKMLVVTEPTRPNTCRTCLLAFTDEDALKRHKEAGCENEEIRDRNTEEDCVAGVLYAGYRSVTVGYQTKFYCDRCKVYCRSSHYFNKHMVLHEENIDVMEYTDIMERRRFMETKIAELRPPKPNPIRKRKRRSHKRPRAWVEKAIVNLRNFKKPVAANVQTSQEDSTKKSVAASGQSSEHNNAMKIQLKEVSVKLPKISIPDLQYRASVERPMRQQPVKKPPEDHETEDHESEDDDLSSESGGLPVIVGYKSMTVEEPTKSWCGICKVYFRNAYYLSKHLVLHERNISVDEYQDITERRMQIERLVAELTPGRREMKRICERKNAKFVNVPFDNLEVEGKMDTKAEGKVDTMEDDKDGMKNGQVDTEDQDRMEGAQDDRDADKTEGLNVQDTGRKEQDTDDKHQERIEDESDVGVEGEKIGMKESKVFDPSLEDQDEDLVKAGIEVMTCTQETSFFCLVCQLYYRSLYYFEKHNIIHINNMPVDTTKSMLVRRQAIEDLIAELNPPRRKDLSDEYMQRRSKAGIYRKRFKKPSKKKKKEEDADPEWNPLLIKAPKNTKPKSRGVKSITADEVTEFYCDRCDMYFRDARCFDKHLVIHTHGINVAHIDCPEERRLSIDHLAAELGRKGKESIKVIPVGEEEEREWNDEMKDGTNDTEMGAEMKDTEMTLSEMNTEMRNTRRKATELKNKMNEASTTSKKTEKDVNTPESDLPLLAQITSQNEFLTNAKPLEALQTQDCLSPEKIKVPTQSNLKDFALKPMTSGQPTKFWCDKCHVYFKNDYFNKKHMLIHEHNIDFGHIDDESERRLQIEQCIRRLSMKPITPKLKSPKSFPVNRRTKFQCPTCFKYFVSNYYLKVHVSEDHKVEPVAMETTMETTSTGTETMPTVSTVSAVSESSTVSEVSTGSTVSEAATVSTVSEAPIVSTVPEVSTVSEASSVPTVPTISEYSTVSEVSTVSTVPEAPTVSEVSISSVSSVPTAPIVPAVLTVSEAPTVPIVPTVSTVSEVSTVSTVSETSTVSTVPTTPTVPTVSTVSEAPTVSSVSEAPTVPTTPTVPTVSTVSEAPTEEHTDQLERPESSFSSFF